MAFLASLKPRSLPVVYPVKDSIFVLFLELALSTLHLHLYLMVLVEIMDNLIWIDLPFCDAIAVVIVDMDALREDHLDIAIDMVDYRELERRGEGFF